MQDRKKLNGLVEIIGALLKVEGNEWLVGALLSKMKAVSSIEEIGSHSVIKDIHEHCIENVIDKQANGFYSDFIIEEIKEKLILDYKKMEHERRQNDFENFTLCVYQQIENVVSYIFNKYVKPNWDRMKSTARTNNDGKRVTIEELIFYNGGDVWYPNYKYKAILFLLRDDSRNFFIDKGLVDTFNEIYQTRNTNHRGSKPTTYQESILNKIRGNESKYYLKFYGFLEDLIRQVNGGKKKFIAKETKKQKKPKNNKIHREKNTIGANNPELKALADKLKKKK